MSAQPARLRATITAEVTDADTAQALGSGDVPVLGTPRLLALAEAACVAAVAPQLEEASPIGAPIEVEAELAGIEGRRFFFNFIAYGPGTGDETVIGAGTAERMLVDRDRFLRGVRDRAA